MNKNIGKKFEDKFKSNWEKLFPGTLIYRLPDQQSGYAGGGSQNPCDFICFTGEKVLLVECKAHAKSSIPFTAIPQYERLLKYKDLSNTFAGVIIWFYDHDEVIWVSIDTMQQMVLDGEKSIGLRMWNSKKPYKKTYNIIKLPSKKVRVFMDTDYTYLVKELSK